MKILKYLLIGPLIGITKGLYGHFGNSVAFWLSMVPTIAVVGFIFEYIDNYSERSSKNKESICPKSIRDNYSFDDGNNQSHEPEDVQLTNKNYDKAVLRRINPSEQNCKNHPDTNALSLCHSCGDYFCQDCLIEGDEYYYCKDNKCQQAQDGGKKDKVDSTYPKLSIEEYSEIHKIHWRPNEMDLTIYLDLTWECSACGILNALAEENVLLEGGGMRMVISCPQCLEQSFIKIKGLVRYKLITEGSVADLYKSSDTNKTVDEVEQEQEKEYEEYLQELKSSIKKDPENAELHFELAMTYMRSGKHRECIDIFKQIIKLEPDHIEANFYLGGMYVIHLKDKVLASQVYEKLKKLDPKRAKQLYKLINK